MVGFVIEASEGRVDERARQRTRWWSRWSRCVARKTPRCAVSRERAASKMLHRRSIFRARPGRPGLTRRAPENVRDRALFCRCPPRVKVGSAEIARTVPGGGDLEGLLIGPLLLRLCLQLQERVAASGRHSGCASGDARTKVAPTSDRTLFIRRSDRRRSLSVQINESLRTATRKLEKRDECETLATPASARLEPDARDFPCTACTLVSGVRGATRG